MTLTYDALEEQIAALDLKSNELTYMRKENANQVSLMEHEIFKLEEEIALLDKVSSLFKHLLDSLLDEKKQEIQKLVTYGLKTVFTDQHLKFHIDIEPKYNTIYTNFRTEQVGVAEGDVLDSFGGGVVNIESFLLRIITLFQTKLTPFLFLDETFSHVSGEYVENTSILLKNICEQLGLTIALITHKEDMLNNADKVYKASSVKNKLKLSEIITNGKGKDKKQVQTA